MLDFSFLRLLLGIIIVLCYISIGIYKVAMCSEKDLQGTPMENIPLSPLPFSSGHE